MLPGKYNEVLESVCADLANQVYETWQKGSLGANSIWLTFEGNIPIQAREALKKELKSHAREIKSVRERRISSRQLTLDVDSGLTTKELMDRIPRLKISEMEFVAATFDDKVIRYQSRGIGKSTKETQ